jgi:CBS domain containing-hemolysin-like protein
MGPLFWFFATLTWTAVMSFYSTQEMACISCNKLRLEYYVKEKKRWAILLDSLLRNPTLLFSTTLIMVNLALMASSECARRTYEALGYNPNFSPLIHIPFVLIFGELVPMFAARLHADHMSRLGIPFLYMSAKILTPAARVVDFFFRNFTRYFSAFTAKAAPAFLNREELQRLLEEHETGEMADTSLKLNATIRNIFALQNKQAFQLMEKITTAACFPLSASVATLRDHFRQKDSPFILLYDREPAKISGVIEAQDLIDVDEAKKIGECARPCSFIAESSPGIHILAHLEKENTRAAIVLDQAGAALGFLTLDDIYEELFTVPGKIEPGKAEKSARFAYFEKTLSAATKVADFNEAYGMDIPAGGAITFADLVEQTLGHAPGTDDSITVGPVEIIVRETSLFRAESVLVRTR